MKTSSFSEATTLMNVFTLETFTCNEPAADYTDIAVGTNDDLTVTVTELWHGP